VSAPPPTRTIAVVLQLLYGLSLSSSALDTAPVALLVDFTPESRSALGRLSLRSNLACGGLDGPTLPFLKFRTGCWCAPVSEVRLYRRRSRSTHAIGVPVVPGD